MIKKYIGGFFGSLAERIVVFFAALFLSQAPQYMNLYLNVLSGSLATYQKEVKIIEDEAASLEMTVKAFIDDLAKSPGKVAQKSAEIHKGQIDRFEKTKKAFAALEKATVFSRPFVFLKHVDWSLAKSVKFQPAFPLTLEAFVYVIIGIILGMLVYRGLMFFPRRWLGGKHQDQGILN